MDMRENYSMHAQTTWQALPMLLSFTASLTSDKFAQVWVYIDCAPHEELQVPHSQHRVLIGQHNLQLARIPVNFYQSFHIFGLRYLWIYPGVQQELVPL